MYDQVKALKEGKAVEKPIYNHVTGVFDPAEKIESPDILILEGLHPFADERVRDMFDFKIYLDISDDVKFCLLYTSPSPRDLSTSRMPSSA